MVEELAEVESISVPGLITAIHDHCPVDERKNLASCLRDFCLQYLNAGKRPTD